MNLVVRRARRRNVIAVVAWRCERCLHALPVSYLPNGLAGDYGGTFFWTRIGGTGLARRLYLLDERIPADEALRLGMVHAVLPAADLAAHTYEVAGRLARVPLDLLAMALTVAIAPVAFPF